jgi:hypothetical protein
VVHAADEGSAEAARGRLLAAFTVAGGAPAGPAPAVRERLA